VDISEDDQSISKNLLLQVQHLAAELKMAQNELGVERNMLSKCNAELLIQKNLAKQEVEDRRFLDKQLEELKNQHVTENRKNLDIISALERQLELSKIDTEQQIDLKNKELHNERQLLKELSNQVTELAGLLDTEKQSKGDVIAHLQDHAKVILSDKNRLEDELMKYEAEKRKNEDHRRQYERAGTDILKLLNDANQKVIILEEHKWHLEDKIAEQKALSENEKKLLIQDRVHMEHELASLKQQFMELTQHHHKTKMELTQQHQQFITGATISADKFATEKGQLQWVIDTLQGNMAELNTKLEVLSVELASSKQSHLDDKQLWEEEKERMVGTHNKIEATLKGECERLQAELDSGRHKIEELKRLLA